MYLCHSFCELGGTPLEDVLDDIHDFLVSNPEEVIVIINQDYVTPEDFVAAVSGRRPGGAGLPRAHGGTWPTLREMIDRDQRAVFLAENHAGAAPWYHLAYESITEETPYSFSKVAQLTDPARPRGKLRAEPGPGRRAVLPRQPLDHHRPVAAPVERRRVNAYEPLLSAHAGVPAAARAAAEPRRGRTSTARETCSESSMS